jgi:hypothetical protein
MEISIMSRFRLFSVALLLLAGPSFAEDGGRGPAGGAFMSSYGPYAQSGPPPRTWAEFYAQRSAADVAATASTRRRLPERRPARR